MFRIKCVDVCFSHFRVDVCRLADRVNLLLGVLRDKHLSRWVDQVALHFPCAAAQFEPVFSKNIVVEILLLLNAALFTQVLYLIFLKLCFRQDSNCFVICRVPFQSPKQTDCAVLWPVVQNLIVHKQLEVNLVRRLTYFGLKLFNATLLNRLDFCLANLNFGVQ